MKTETKRTRRVLVALATAVLSARLGLAKDTTKVGGDVTDLAGQPLPKVEVVFENAEIKEKRAGPVKTNKKGHYIFPFLDIGIEPKWRVVPSLPGYKVLKVTWKLVDSERQDRGSGEMILNSKQEFPVIKPVPIGDSGVNDVDFVMVKEQEFANALREAAQKSGGTGAGSPTGGASAATAPAAGTDPFGATAPAGAPAKGVSEALELLEAGKNEEAIPILTEFLEKNPNNAPVQFTLGKACVNAKQYEQAIAPLQKSLQIDPNHAGSHFFLGVAYSQMGQDEGALKEFLAEIPISPGEDVAYSNAASLYEKQGKVDEAIQYYRKAIEINASRPELHASLAKLYDQKGNRAMAEAEYKTLADLDPANASVTWYNIGAIAKNSNKNDDAVRAFKKAVELDPGYAQAHRELGYALVKDGEFQQAVSHMRKYLELSPKAPDGAEIREMIKQLSQ